MSKKLRALLAAVLAVTLALGTLAISTPDAQAQTEEPGTKAPKKETKKAPKPKETKAKSKAKAEPKKDE